MKRFSINEEIFNQGGGFQSMKRFSIKEDVFNQ